LVLCRIRGSLMHWFPFISIQSVVLLCYISCVIHDVVIMLVFVILFHYQWVSMGGPQIGFVPHLWVSHALVSIYIFKLWFCFIMCLVWFMLLWLYWYLLHYFNNHCVSMGGPQIGFCATYVGLSCTGFYYKIFCPSLVCVFTTMILLVSLYVLGLFMNHCASMGGPRIGFVSHLWVSHALFYIMMRILYYVWYSCIAAGLLSCVQWWYFKIWNY
jgi:hypothetical protein